MISLSIRTEIYGLPLIGRIPLSLFPGLVGRWGLVLLLDRGRRWRLRVRRLVGLGGGGGVLYVVTDGGHANPVNGTVMEGGKVVGVDTQGFEVSADVVLICYYRIFRFSSLFGKMDTFIRISMQSLPPLALNSSSNLKMLLDSFWRAIQG